MIKVKYLTQRKGKEKKNNRETNDKQINDGQAKDGGVDNCKEEIYKQQNTKILRNYGHTYSVL